MKQKWLENTSEEILKKVELLPESFLRFKNELLEKPDKVNDLIIVCLDDIWFSDHFVIAKFQVKSETTGQTYYQEYISRRGGKYHSLRGIVLVKQEGKITHFVVRKCNRFGIGQQIFESIGNIYQPNEEFQKDKILLSSYIKDELAKCLHVPKINIDQFYDLGNVLTDTSMFNNVVRVFAVTIEVGDLSELTLYLKDKIFDDKGYSFQIETIPIEKFFEFFGQAGDSFLLAIFGRLQALNVIKL